jgi:hypothetical protein
MTHRLFSAVVRAGLALASIFISVAPALAGPPLICHPFEIGSARSLPWRGEQWRDVAADYDINRLVDDTTALLAPETPVLVRMETLRRATIYAVWSKADRKVGFSAAGSNAADELLARLVARAHEHNRDARIKALALFDAGYLVEAYREAGFDLTSRAYAREIDGYAWVTEAIRQIGGEPSMEYAAALIAWSQHRPEVRTHLERAAAGAPDGALLSRNLERYFANQGTTLSAFRAGIGGQ